MDGDRFDNLARWLAVARSRRAVTRLFGGGALVAPLAAFTLGDSAAKGKGKGKKSRKKPVCTCSASGCTSQKVKNRTKLIQQNPRCNYAGNCTTNPCAMAVPLSPP